MRLRRRFALASSLALVSGSPWRLLVLHCHFSRRSARRSARMSGRPNANAKRAGVGINWPRPRPSWPQHERHPLGGADTSPNAVVKILGTWMFVTVWPPCATWPPRDGAGAADLPKPPTRTRPTRERGRASSC